ncbi:sulfite exporter TauE/SafE family protein [Nostoc paludosum FACHB-159]|uniref:Probable membrane transporter protein n=2 Tax=Nostoc TaxID=1177 RepID=A0ABR8KL65_9NOSO|nr:sulfite exporter TauE/SafE family protein [Nostoc paludosum]MBD2682575.1 sulfite exporter TauE/SafE family protein [Nostoc sp. FACHB-857]MBD2738930.1 sulfite exporter TauE/SafE family protein [Nostoc paludosum FACHB-159]
MLSIEWMLLYILLGLFVGFMAGLLGVGGGGILVPLLVSIFSNQGVNADNVVHLALGTTMACTIISSIASIRAHAAQGTVVWKVVYGMTPGIMVGTLLITRIAANVNSAYIAIFFALFMALVAGQMFLNWRPKASRKPAKFRGLFLAGTGIGSVSALAAVGGGFLTVTYLSYQNVEMKKAIGTSSAIGFPIAIAGTVGYMMSGWSQTVSVPYTLGFIYVPAFLIIAIASSIAAPYGVRCSHRLPETHLKKIFAVLSLVLSIKMLFSVV